jgi:hypothetical protein
MNTCPTIVRGVLMLDAAGSRQNTACRAELLDAAGRKVMRLQAGATQAGSLVPGSHFCSLQGGGSRISRKVVLAEQAKRPLGRVPAGSLLLLQKRLVRHCARAVGRDVKAAGMDSY